MFTMVNDFKDWIQDEMRKRNWSQAELARRADVARSGINMLITQERQPGLELCLAIAEAFDIHPIYVLQKAGIIPEDQTVYEFDLEGRATIELPDDNPAIEAAFSIFDKILESKAM